MRLVRTLSHAAISTAALALLLALPSAASARKLQMSGTWALRTGQLFVPFQFARTLQGNQMTMTSMGNLSKGFSFPFGPIPGAGIVTATGSAPQALEIPRHRFVMNGGAAVPLYGITVVQITTMLVIDAPHETAMLWQGGGPGSFTWCPSDPACTDPLGPDPPPGGLGTNGRIVYRAGANQFGGTIQLGLSGSGSLTLVHQGFPRPVHFAQHYLSIGPTAVAVGGAYATTRMVYPTPGAVFESPGYNSDGGLILFWGPRLTTMGGLTTSCSPSCGAPLLPPAVSSTQWGFPATTGTVLAQQTTGTAGDDFFTVMGSDMRTLLGAGNISLVAGGLTRRNAPLGPTSYAVFQKVWMTLAAPTPSLSPAGIAAAAALVLLATACTLRRRFGGPS